MSFKDVTVQLSPTRYLLPKVGKMHVPVEAFLTPELFAATEEALWHQAAAAASYPGVEHVFLMPDTHSGYGVPVGAVVVTNGSLIQAGSGYDISCFTGDTEVSLVDGRTLSFKQLVELYGSGGDFYVYSTTPERKITAGRAHNPRKIRTSVALVEVELDNGKKIRNTPDHEYQLRDGTYQRADRLQPGDSLMSLYRTYDKGYCPVRHQSEKGRSKSREIGLGNKSTETLQCPHCGKSYKGRTGLGVHLNRMHNNRKVIAVRPLCEREDVYCLTVDKYENFALSAGVFVHNCGILYMKSDLHASEVVDPALRLAWIRAVEERVATGLGSHQPDKMVRHDWKFVKDVLVHGAAPLGVHADTCERLSIPVEEKLFNPERIERGWQKTAPQLGSLGGGNHFIEMQVDPVDSSVWLMIHTGSRGFGWHTAEHYYYEGAKVRGLARNRREESWLGLDEPMGREFWAHHNAAANYAIANRHVIASGVRKATEAVFGKSAETYYEISHNLIQKERIYLPDGTLHEGYVHRKGATRAFPAGHPDLHGTKWETTGHPCLIPGSMLHGAAILFALEGAKASGCSVNHGSGRLLGRGDAKRSLAVLHDEIDAEMHGARVTCTDGTVVDGIVLNTERTPLDECAHAYKSLDVVLGILESEGIAKVQRRMLPVCNIKGTD